MKAIILISEASLPLAKTLQRELPDTLIYTKNECEGCISITSCHRFIEEHFNDFDSIIFIGAMGICVRSIAGCIKNKYKDPAVVCVDSTGRFVISVLSGHVGGANALARRIAAAIGAQAAVTTAPECRAGGARRGSAPRKRVPAYKSDAPASIQATTPSARPLP